MIFQTELVLGVFGMVPAIMFAVTAITRDHDRNTLELFFSTPVSRNAFVLGRFSAGTIAAVLVGCRGLLGAFTGTLMPWLDPDRIAPLRLAALGPELHDPRVAQCPGVLFPVLCSARP